MHNAKYTTVGAIAEFLHCPILGDGSQKIYGMSLFQESREGTLSCVPSHKISGIAESHASAFLTRAAIALPLHRNYIITRNDPYEMLAQTVQFLIDEGLYSQSASAPPQIPDSCQISNYVSIGNGSIIGENTILAPGVVIEENVTIGNNCKIGANTVIGAGSVIGNHVIIGSCCCIGTENFEYYQTRESWVKIPVVGGITIGNHVRIGGNVVIEKGTIGTTLIDDHTEIDNLVQIGHEVKIGAHCHIVACTALAGWAEIADHVTIYGQTGISNYVKVGSHSILLARTGADKSIKENAIVSGFPAQNHQREMRFQAFLRNLFHHYQKGK